MTTPQSQGASVDDLRTISGLIDRAASLADSKGEMKPEVVGKSASIGRHKLALLCQMVRRIGVANVLGGLGIVDETLQTRLENALQHAEDVEHQHEQKGGISTTFAMFRWELGKILAHTEVIALMQPNSPAQYRDVTTSPDPDMQESHGGHPRDVFSKEQVMGMIALDRTAARLGVLLVLSDHRVMEAFLGLID